ncbi:uncharacterized protein LOC105391742 [Plutella xylostella]|uniref:uncharacterized protein LOC105391742 n=1 Tax=Plutella xylostella TaxID=51655 RepID=UPI002032ACF8|nr:uncharacterized protein LOC105391742 [Plutella xylostella]
MGDLLRSVVFLSCFAVVVLTEPPCIFELECPECVPDNMPLVTSHRAANGSVAAASGDEVVLACHGGKFLQYPMDELIIAVCEGGRLRVRQDGARRHVLELGCQESVFEDVLHPVENCGPPLQGRAYQFQYLHAHTTGHLATLCFDQDRAIAVRSHACNGKSNLLTMPAHNEQNRSPLSLLGNFNQMFDTKNRNDAEKLYGDDVSLNKRLQELLKHERYTFADQVLTSGKLLSGHYFDDQNARVTEFVSNKLAVWKSVATGNLKNIHKDVAKIMHMTRSHTVLDIYAGTHGVLSLRTGHNHTDVYLKPGQRFPVPKYIWTVVHDKKNHKAAAIVLVNDPFVAVSEIRETLFCESACSRISWLHELRRNHNYETPVYGLVFCCNVHDFTNVVNEMPKNVFKNVHASNDGLLTNFNFLEV